MSKTIEISDELYERLLKAAERYRETPLEWIERQVPQLPKPIPEGAGLSGRLKGIIGSVAFDDDDLPFDPNDPLFEMLRKKKREGRF